MHTAIPSAREASTEQANSLARCYICPGGRHEMLRQVLTKPTPRSSGIIRCLAWMQLFIAIAVAHARNDPPPASDKTWAPPNLPKYETELADRRFSKTESANI